MPNDDNDDQMLAAMRSASDTDGRLPPQQVLMIRNAMGFLKEACRTDRDWRELYEMSVSMAERFGEIVAGPRLVR